MKKILGLSVAALLVIAMVGGGTWAFFQDTENIAGNAISAGTLDLTVTGQGTGKFEITADQAYPGNSADGGYYFTLANAGSLDGNLSLTLTSVLNTESNGTTEFEHDTTGDTNATASVSATGGSTTTVVNSAAPFTADELIGKFVTIPGKGWRQITDNDTTTITFDPAFTTAVTDQDTYIISDAKAGELGANAKVRLWISENNGGVFSGGGTDYVLESDGGVSNVGDDYTAALYTIDTLDDVDWTDILTDIGIADTLYLFIDWEINDSGAADNSFQGDSVEFDLEFVLEQAD